MEFLDPDAIDGNGPLYDWAARTSAQVVNLLADSSEPKHVLYAKVLFLFLHSMYAAQAELNGQRFEPSDN